MHFENWLMFCFIALLATATPGPAALLVSINSISFGFKKSLITVLGNVTGLFIMSIFSVLGLSAMVLHSKMAFTVIKIFGAIYLAYLGFNFWVNGVGNIEASSTKKTKDSRLSLYTQGVIPHIPLIYRIVPVNSRLKRKPGWTYHDHTPH